MQQVTLVVAAVVRNGDAVVLVRQQGPEDLQPRWALPGGVVAPGELLAEALARELREETGLALTLPGVPAYVAQIDEPVKGRQTLAFVFEVGGWTGELRHDDPDGLILGAEWTPLEEACARLERLPWRAMREPALAYLREETPIGGLWLYRGEELVERLA